MADPNLPNNNPGAAALPPLPPPPAEESGVKLFDNLAMMIIGGAIVISLIIVAVMYSGYRHARNTAFADRYYTTGQYDRAVPYLIRIVTKYPGAWTRYKMLGDCYMLSKEASPNKENFRQALKCYQLVLQSPGYQEKLNNPSTPPDEKLDLDLNEEVGICSEELGDEKKAQECFAKVQAQEPDSPAMNFYIGVQYFKSGNYRQAAHCFQNTATGDHAVAEGNDTEIQKQASKWGNYWDKKAEPYRRELAKKMLEIPMAAPAATKPGGQKG